MTYGILLRGVGLCALVAACGSNEAKPIAKIDADDRRAEQVRERAAGAELAPMLSSDQPGRVIYDPPPNLSKLPPDSATGAGARDTSSSAARRDSSAAGTSGAAARDTSRRSPNS